MSIKQELDTKVGNWALINSRFYNAWNEGKLKRSALMHYAAEYGSFIQMLPKGWQTLNDAETVTEEIEHAELWDVFAQAMDTEVTSPSTQEVAGLIETTDKLFSSPVTAMGAMYAFEVQQPETAESKLDGLRKYYPVSGEAEEYFKVHAVNHHESEKLLASIAELPEVDQAEAVEACEEMSKALWDALEGIYVDTMEK